MQCEGIVDDDPVSLPHQGREPGQNRRAYRPEVRSDRTCSQLRLQGIEDLKDVKLACMEGDGRISAIDRKKDDKGTHPAPERRITSAGTARSS